MKMTFPVLRINKGHIRKFDSPSQLRLMSKKYLDKGDFKKETFFIDADGNRFSLANILSVRRSLNPLRWFRSSPAIVVDFEIQHEGSLSLPQIKNIVSVTVVENKWFGQGHQTQRQFEKMIDDAASIRDLFHSISYYGEWQG